MLKWNKKWEENNKNLNRIVIGAGAAAAAAVQIQLVCYAKYVINDEKISYKIWIKTNCY